MSKPIEPTFTAAQIIDAFRSEWEQGRRHGNPYITMEGILTKLGLAHHIETDTSGRRQLRPASAPTQDDEILSILNRPALGSWITLETFWAMVKDQIPPEMVDRAKVLAAQRVQAHNASLE